MFRKIDESPFLKLEYVYRFSNKPLTVRDSDAMHTVRIQLYLLEAISQCPGTFDVKKACFKGLVHDLDEVGSGDINRIFKYRDKELTENIKRVAREMVAESGLPDDIITEIDNAKSDDIEGFLVRFYDAFDAYRTLMSQYRITGIQELVADYNYTKGIMDYILTDLKPQGISQNLIDYLRSLYV